MDSVNTGGIGSNICRYYIRIMASTSHLLMTCPMTAHQHQHHHQQQQLGRQQEDVRFVRCSDVNKINGSVKCSWAGGCPGSSCWAVAVTDNSSVAINNAEKAPSTDSKTPWLSLQRYWRRPSRAVGYIFIFIHQKAGSSKEQTSSIKTQTHE